MLNKCWVVIPAAGVGARMQTDRPKQYLPLVGKTVIEHTLACFLEHPAVVGIVVAISEGTRIGRNSLQLRSVSGRMFIPLPVGVNVPIRC